MAAIAREMAAFPMGHRPGGRSSVSQDVSVRSFRCVQGAAGVEADAKGGELPSLVMWPGCRPTPVL